MCPFKIFILNEVNFKKFKNLIILIFQKYWAVSKYPWLGFNNYINYEVVKVAGSIINCIFDCMRDFSRIFHRSGFSLRLISGCELSCKSQGITICRSGNLVVSNRVFKLFCLSKLKLCKSNIRISHIPNKKFNSNLSDSDNNWITFHF